MGRGATFKEVSKEVIERLDIVLPPVPVQKHIASILGKADLIRQKRAEAQRFAADLIPALFNEMFGDPVMNQKKWKTFKLGELCRIRRGGSPRPIENYLNGTIPWVKIGDGTMGDEIYINKTKQKITKEGVKKSLLLKPGALIFANCGVSLGCTNTEC
jgi:type I restriction enzyme S subunit